MSKLKRGFTLIETLIALIVIAVLTGGGWYVWHNKQSSTTNTSAKTSENDSQPTIESIESKVIVTLGAKGEQGTVQTNVRDFYQEYRTDLSKNDNSKKVAKLLEENLTEKAQAYVNKGHYYDPLTCHQYSPMLVVGIPDVNETSATVVIQPIDLRDMDAEKPNTITLAKQDSKWLIDTVSCPST